MRQKLKEANEEKEHTITAERKELVNNLKSYQENKGLSITALAESLQIGRSTISLWFSGRSLPAEYLAVQVKIFLSTHNNPSYE